MRTALGITLGDSQGQLEHIGAKLGSWLDAQPHPLHTIARLAARAVDASDEGEPRGFYFEADATGLDTNGGDPPEPEVWFHRATLDDPFTAFFPSEY